MLLADFVVVRASRPFVDVRLEIARTGTFCGRHDARAIRSSGMASNIEQTKAASIGLPFRIAPEVPLR